MFSQLAPCRKSWWYLLIRIFTYLSSVFHIVFTKSCWCKEIDYTCAFGYNWWQKMFYVVFTSPYKIIWFSIDFNKFTSSFGSTWPSSNFLISLYVLILFLIFLKASLSNVFLFLVVFCDVECRPPRALTRKIFEIRPDTTTAKICSLTKLYFSFQMMMFASSVCCI